MKTRRTEQVTKIMTLCLAAILWAGVAPAAEEAFDDNDIMRAIDTAFVIDDSIASHFVDIRVAEGVVTLTGSVGNLLARERAGEIAASIKGVRAVINRLVVRTVAREDKEIKRDVELSLLIDPASDTYEIETTVKDGIVTLEGSVDSWAEKQLAARVVKGVKGVIEVVNNIKVSYDMDRADHEIETEIERRLESDVWVDAVGIEVGVSDGRVNLSGRVGSVPEKWRAVYDSWVAGVRSVDDSGLEVKWWARDEARKKEAFTYKPDDELKQAVLDALKYDPRVLSFRIDVEVDKGVVTLNGMVDNLMAKRAAAKDARDTVGVWRVENNIKVRPAAPLGNNVLAQNVREAIARDPYLERWDIGVAAYNGKVYLSGEVDTEFERLHAQGVASRVNNVAVVDNNIKVSSPKMWKSDWAIQQDVQDQLFWSMLVDSDAITVTVEDGVVTLAGSVESLQEKNAAAVNAYEGGAREVRNHLVVDSGMPEDIRRHYWEPERRWEYSYGWYF